ncbi:MAG: hypothetical protein AAFU70_14410, partial [Planctomycetota bacterium]
LCIECGYDLGGLPPEASCPECALSADESLRAPTMLGRSAGFVRGLRDGARLIHVMILSVVIVSIVVAAIAGGAAAAAVGGLSLTVIIGLAAVLQTALVLGFHWGWWRFTGPDPGGMRMGETDGARKTTRVATAIAAAIALLALPSQLITASVTATPAAGNPNAGPSALFLIAMIVSAVLGFLSFGAYGTQFIAGLIYVRQIGRRSGDETLRRRAATRVWLIPALVVGGYAMIFVTAIAAAAVGPVALVGMLFLLVGLLGALVMYYNLFIRARKTLTGVLKEIELESARRQALADAPAESSEPRSAEPPSN